MSVLCARAPLIKSRTENLREGFQMTRFMKEFMNTLYHANKLCGYVTIEYMVLSYWNSLDR